MKLHHIGKVVSDLNEARKYYKETFKLDPAGPPVVDPIQKVELVFVKTGIDDEFMIELIRPLSKDSPVFKFQQEGGGFHHLCFEVDDVNAEIERLKGKGALILGNPVPGRGHGDRLTAWIYTLDKELVELVEKGD